MLVILYKRVDEKLRYWQIWNRGRRTAIIHEGVVGQTGQAIRFKSPGIFSNIKGFIEEEVEKKYNEGYKKFDKTNCTWLEIEYIIEGFGTNKDVNKRHRLENRMDELLESTGLGSSNGGDMGGGIMGVGCTVVDFDAAKTVIEQNLKNSEFEDYSRIYRRK